MTVGTILTGMAKEYVKNQIRKKSLEVIQNTMKSDTMSKYYNGNNVFFKSHKDIDRAFGHIRRGIGLTKNTQKLYKAKGINQSYKNSKGLYEKAKYQIKNIEGVEKLKLRRDNINLKDMEKYVFEFSQRDMSVLKKSEKGVFWVDDLLRDEKFKDIVGQINVTVKEQKEYTFSKYDANYLFKQFRDDGTITLEELSEKLVKRYKDKDQAEKELQKMLKRLEKHIEHDFVRYNPEENKYIITAAGKDEADRVGKLYEFTTYDANVICKYIEKNNGALSLSQLNIELLKEYDSPLDRIKQLEYLERRMDKSVEHGYLGKNTEGFYFIDEKGLQALNEIRSLQFEKSTEFIYSKLDYYAYLGFLNKRAEGYFEVTDHFYRSIETQDIKDVIKDTAKNENFKPNNFHKYILFRVDDEGLSLSKLLDEYKNDIKVEDPLKKIELVEKGCERLLIQGYLSYQDDKYFLTNIAQELLEKIAKPKTEIVPIEFGYFEVRIHRMMEENNGFLSFDNIRHSTEQDKQRMFDLRLSKLERDGYIVPTDRGYIKTEKFNESNRLFMEHKHKERLQGNLKLYDFENTMLEFAKKEVCTGKTTSINHFDINELVKDDSFKNIRDRINKNKDMKNEFVFGKYDANVVMGEFKENKKTGIYELTAEGLKSNLLKRYKDQNKADEQFKILYNRIEKNVKHGYVDFDETTKSFSITSKGQSEAKAVRSKFVFTSYDENVVFGYIEKNNGKLSLKELENILKSEYSDSEYCKKQLIYLSARFDKNVEAGYLIKDHNDVYSISDYAKQELIKKNEDISKILEHVHKKVDFLIKAGLIVKHTDSIFEVTQDFLNLQEKHLLKSEIKLSNIEKSLLRRADNGTIDIVKEIEKLQLRYKNNDKELKRQANLLNGSCENLKKNGFLTVEGTKYKLTDKAFQALEEKLNEKPVSNKDFVFGSYDANLISKYFKNNKLSLPELQLQLKEKYLDDNRVQKQLKIDQGRLLKNVKYGYMYFDEKSNSFILTDLGIKSLREFNTGHSRASQTQNIRGLIKSYKLDEERYKTHILELHKNDSPIKSKTKFNADFNIKKAIDETLKDAKSIISPNTKGRTGYIVEKVYPEPIGTNPKGNPINTLRVVLDENMNVRSAFPAKNTVENLDGKHDLRKYNLTKFDYQYIAGGSIDNIWSVKNFRKNFPRLDRTNIEQKIQSVEKRLKTLEQVGYVKRTGNGEYLLDDLFIEREKNWKEKKTYSFSTGQMQVFNDIKSFLNLTDKQISSYVYNGNELLAQSDVQQLVRKGYLGEASRDLQGNGHFTKIYYLTTEGKKAASHLSGNEVEKIYSSKLHNRPEELRHDVMVYSAFKDYEKRLESVGCKVTKTMTDKQMRAYDMSTAGKQRIEYSDLYIEFEDIKTGEKGYVNIEMDCGYKPTVIKSKAENIDHLVWYTDSQNQKSTIMRTLKDANVITLSF